MSTFKRHGVDCDCCSPVEVETGCYPAWDNHNLEDEEKKRRESLKFFSNGENILDKDIFKGLQSGFKKMMEQRSKFIDIKLIERFKELGIDYKEELLKEPKRLFKKYMVIHDRENNTIQYRMNDGTDDGVLLIEFKDVSFGSMPNYR